MEIWGMVAVGFFTLAGVIVSNYLQQRIMEKQRKNSLSDEASKLKRELMGSRLKIAEEQIGLISRILDNEINTIIGHLPSISQDESGIIKRRIDEISSEAWIAIHVVGSEKLKEYYSVITHRYWGFIQTGSLTQDPDEWEKLNNAEVAIIEIMDNLRVWGSERDI
ncbi:hypothetical protein ACFLWW_02395 [Chloroflexota bacterium]